MFDQFNTCESYNSTKNESFVLGSTIIIRIPLRAVVRNENDTLNEPLIDKRSAFIKNEIAKDLKKIKDLS